MRGPNLSRRLVKLQAGWYGESLCSGATSAAPSEAERFLLCPLRFWFGSDGKAMPAELTGASSLGSWLGRLSGCGLLVSQYFSRMGVSLRFSASFLVRGQ